ncbi:MAG: hypothetical protein HY924_07610 [Elusimicrobia bacterium]|nr:hypothetical protein [Elusimicrobiota bacterium]
MDKATLVRRLDALILTEEAAVPIYLDHIDAVLSWSGFSPASKARAAETMRSMAEECVRHRRMLQELKVRALGRKTDVF